MLLLQGQLQKPGRRHKQIPPRPLLQIQVSVFQVNKHFHKNQDAETEELIYKSIST